MELSHLRYFYNVARTRSFVKGAQLSSISPPAMSKAVKKLEEELDTLLLVRTTRSAALTQSGEILLEHCRVLFERVEAMERALDEARDKVAGPLRVGAMEVFSTFLLPKALVRLVGEHPDVIPSSYEVLAPDLERHVLEGTVDVGFTIGGQGARGVRYEHLGTSPGVIVCGRAHPLYESGRVSRRELPDHPFVVPRFLGREHLPPIDQFPDKRIPRTVGATIELMQMGIQMTLAGAFLGYFPEVSVREHLEAGRLRALKGIRTDAPFELRAVTREGLPPKVAALELVEMIRDLVGNA